jgi:hypothetical protein
MSTTLIEQAEAQPGGRSEALKAFSVVGQPRYSGTSGSLVIRSEWHPYTTDTHDGGIVLWPDRPPFEDGLRLPETARCLQRLAAPIVTTESVLPCSAAHTLEASVAIRMWAFLLTRPQCPLLALAFAAMVQPLKVVERVICQGDASRSELTIWTIVNHATEAQRYAIYDKQWDVMQVFQGSAVEFNLVDREDSPLEDLMQWSDRAFVVEV